MLLGSMAQIEASDLHLKVGYPPYFRVRGALRAAKMPPLPDTKYIEDMLRDLVPEQRREEYDKTGALDFATRGSSGDRYRINMFRCSGLTHASIRRVQSEIPSFETLNLPEVYSRLVTKCIDGLILVSGITGCGKSTTLAALVDHINQIRSMHIITIEDPVEFVFKPKKSIISQREIGVDVANFRDALRYVVRQDPDCILIGELRDRETMSAAIQAAETGHLVLGSLHVSDVQQTFSRILEFFPRSDHSLIRSSIANSLRAVTCQRLLPGIEPGTRFPATEVLVSNTIVKDKILREKDEDLPGVISQSREQGMRSFTDSLCELIETEKVHYDTAMELAPSREALESVIKGFKAG
jgi:twitching motility protein PilT